MTAVAPDFSRGYVYRGWKGDKELTTAGDIVNKYTALRAGRPFAGSFYDYADADFYIIANRMGEPFQRANKAHDAGEMALNTLFKNGILEIFDVPELQPLIHELENLARNTMSRNSVVLKNDMSDALRYNLASVPWDYSKISLFPEIEVPEHIPGEVELRRQMFDTETARVQAEIYEEFDEWNSLYEVS
jgi:hypothetical protein